MDNDKYRNSLYDKTTPLIFSDGTKIYEDLKKEYITHDRGYFIYGPSGVGKTHFINRQKEKNWIDGNLLWSTTKAFPKEDWWTWSGTKQMLLKEGLMLLQNKLKN